MIDAIRFALPSLGNVRGSALPHDSGRVTLSVIAGPAGGVCLTIGAMTPAEARTIANALIAAADMAASAKADAEEAVAGRAQ